jgi:hypothetical protein
LFGLLAEFRNWAKVRDTNFRLKAELRTFHNGRFSEHPTANPARLKVNAWCQPSSPRNAL